MTTLSDEQRAEVRSAINRSWNGIMWDVGEVESNAVAVELAIDAGRIEEISQTAEKIIRQLIDSLGYPKALKLLAKEVKLTY